MSFSHRTGRYAVLLNTKCRIAYDDEESCQKDVKVLFSNADNQVISRKEKHHQEARLLIWSHWQQEECLFKLLEDLDHVCHICKRFKKPPTLNQ